MKKLIPLVTALVMLASCAPLNSTYTMSGHVADSDLIVTVDGNAWAVTTDIAVCASVIVTFDDNGTPDYIYDDIVVSVAQD